MVGVIALVVTGWITYVPLVARGTERMPWLQATQHPSLEVGESCEFQAVDGITLQGTYVPTPEANRMGVVLCLHELTGDRWSMWPYVASLNRRGFDVLLFDFRNHGASDATRGYEPLAWVTRYELWDAEAAIQYLLTRPDADSRGLGIVGVSRGGAVALAAAARDRRVRAVVTDGAYSTYLMQVHYSALYVDCHASRAT